MSSLIGIMKRYLCLGRGQGHFCHSTERHGISRHEEPYCGIEAPPPAREGSHSWIDAFCINQSDDAERKEHVRHLGDMRTGLESFSIARGRGSSNINNKVKDLASKAKDLLLKTVKGVKPFLRIYFLKL